MADLRAMACQEPARRPGRSSRLEEVATAIEEAVHLSRCLGTENRQQYTGLVRHAIELATPFGDPKSARGLAAHLHLAGMKEFHYRFWSESAHAGIAMEAIGRKCGTTFIRPVRHSEQLQSAVQHAVGLALDLAKRLAKIFAPAKWPLLQASSLEKISKRAGELASGRLMHAPWKDTVL
jgi:hypothetical protein